MLSRKITTALNSFEELTYTQFTTELKKQKIRLTLSQQDEYEEYFNLRKAECQVLMEKIIATESEIDHRVCDLYGLTPEERQIVLEEQ